MVNMGSCLPRSQKPATADDTLEASESENFSVAKPDILLVFTQDDKQCLSFQQAARLANYKCKVVKSMDLILSSCLEHSTNVIIVDTRQGNQIESMCKTFSTLHNREHLVLVAVLESLSSSSEDKTYDVVMRPLIQVGFTRQFVENLSVNVCLMELQCIEHGELLSRFQAQMTRSFLAAVENCNESVEITNATNEIKYVNSSFERLFGYTKQEVIGSTFLDLMSCQESTGLNIIATMKSQMQQGIPWKGITSACKKDGSLCSHLCQIIPILSQSGHVQNFVLVRSEMGGTLTSPRSTSLDLLSGGNQVTNTHRMSMAIEDPLSQVTHMIRVIQATCPKNVAESLEKVLEVLRTSELNIALKDDDLDNQMTTELLEGLMTAPTMRETSSSAAITEVQRKSIPGASFCPKLPQFGCGQLSLRAQAILSKESKWDFNILEFEKLTDKKPLQFLCMKVFERFGVAEFLRIDQGTLYQWTRVMESHYHASNPYHNSTHAGDVMHAAAYFLNLDMLKNFLDVDEKVAVLLAAIVHDLDHPGKTNSYLINSNSHVAQLYNDLTVLESHHVSFAFRLTHQDVSIDIFQNLHRDQYRRVRQQIIDMVLATEISKHMEHLSRFMHNVINQAATSSDMFARRATVSQSSAVDINTIIKRMLIKCADVSNSARPRALSIIWAERISEEYFQQTDDEKANGLPVVMPLFDRRICNIAKSQLSFMNLFIIDMFDAWHTFCNIPDLIDQIQANHAYWKEQDSPSTRNASVNSDTSAVPKTAV